MREILPKIIGGVVLVAVIGGGVMMVTRHKNTAPVAGVTPAPVAQMESPPPVSTDQPKYKRDMLDYDDTQVVAAPPPKVAPVKTATVAPPPVQHPSNVPGVGYDPARISPPAPVVAASEYAGRTTLQTGKPLDEMKLESAQIKPGQKISLYYTCYQKNVSPPLSWSNAPRSTKSFVVLMEGPDKGRGQPLQWGVYNIPSSQTSLPEGLPKIASNDKGLGQAETELGPIGYAGPCIPRGQVTFVFSVYALDTELKLHGGATRNELIGAMNGHVIDVAKLPVMHYFRL